MKTRTKESKRRLHSLILLTAFTAVLLIVSTYAWFTKQEVVRVEAIRGKVEVAEGLEISLDANKWVASIDLGDEDVSLFTPAGTGGIVYGPYSSHNNHVSPEFLPVSSSGETYYGVHTDETVSASAKDRLILYNGDYVGSSLSNIGETSEGHQAPQGGGAIPEGAALVDEKAGYIAFDVFIKNASKNTISGGETLQLNSDSYAWVLPTNEPITEGTGNEAVKFVGNADSGLQNTIRVGFAKYGNAVNANDDTKIPSTAIASDVIAATETQLISDVAIWEPNHDAHVPNTNTNVYREMRDQMGGVSAMNDYVAEYDANDSDTVKKWKPFFTHTLNKNAINKEIGVFKWNTITAEGGLTKTWTFQTKDKGNASGLIGTGNTDIRTIENTPTTVENFKTLKLAPNSITKLRLYIWIEGQDPDCVNFASYGGGVHVNLAFTKGKELGEDGDATGSVDPDTPRNEANEVGGE